jgi:nitrogen fixation protein FixH
MKAADSAALTPAEAIPPKWMIWRFGWFWPVLVVALLSLNVAVCLITLAVATGDPSMAIEPDYHQQAVDWDQSASRQRASDALGWECEPQVGAPLNPRGERRLTLVLHDRAGEPITGGQVALSYFHHARAEERFQATLPALPDEAGHYGAVLPLARAGTWELRLTVAHGAETFVSRQLITVK